MCSMCRRLFFVFVVLAVSCPLYAEVDHLYQAPWWSWYLGGPSGFGADYTDLAVDPNADTGNVVYGTRVDGGIDRMWTAEYLGWQWQADPIYIDDGATLLTTLYRQIEDCNASGFFYALRAEGGIDLIYQDEFWQWHADNMYIDEGATLLTTLYTDFDVDYNTPDSAGFGLRSEADGNGIDRIWRDQYWLWHADPIYTNDGTVLLTTLYTDFASNSQGGSSGLALRAGGGIDTLYADQWYQWHADRIYTNDGTVLLETLYTAIVANSQASTWFALRAVGGIDYLYADQWNQWHADKLWTNDGTVELTTLYTSIASDQDQSPLVYATKASGGVDAISQDVGWQWHADPILIEGGAAYDEICHDIVHSPASSPQGDLFVAWGLPQCVPLFTPETDIDHDCQVNLSDFAVIADDWLLGEYYVTSTAPNSLGLVAYYKFELDTDDSASYPTGPYPGTMGVDPCNPAWVSGRIDNFALEFDGDGDYINCGTFNPSETTGQLTISLWADWKGTNGNYQTMVSKRNAWDSNSMMWQLYTGSLDNDTSIKFATQSNGSWFEDVNIPQNLGQWGQWTHVAVTYDGNEVVLYIDGLNVSPAVPFTMDNGTTADVVIGASQSNGNESFNGRLDDIRIYDYALSHAEVAYLALEGPGEQVLHSLQSYGNLSNDEPEGSRIVDFKDIAVLAEDWLSEYYYTLP